MFINGRLGSLLEVGTGFHPAPSVPPQAGGRPGGRTPTFCFAQGRALNGAILRMKRAEIDRKFDEIVAFAEIEKFMDTPVKHYPLAWLRESSSGMCVRLAFAVATQRWVKHYRRDFFA